jgi:hypothetical protein
MSLAQKYTGKKVNLMVANKQGIVFFEHDYFLNVDGNMLSDMLYLI